MTNSLWLKYGLIALSTLVLSGCASKLADAEEEKVLDYSMTYSKKIEIVHSATSKTFVTVTYLTPLIHENVTQETEKFIVGTYLATGDGSSSPLIKLFGFMINNEQEEVKVTPLTHDSPLLKLVPSANAWTNYVLVEAPKSDKLKMEISFESDQTQRVSAAFQKDF
jgi:hypothetical protein